MRRRDLLLGASALAVLPLILSSASRAQGRPFRFGLIGDMPYTASQEKQFQRVIAELNAADLAFVVHVGDMQPNPRSYQAVPGAAPPPCTDARNQFLYEAFQTIRHPVIVTPGDNDWTDCHLVPDAGVDPLERLAKLRAVFYPQGRSLGRRTLTVESEAKDASFAKFRENLRWSSANVTFTTLHIVGSNDNLGRTPGMDAEHHERKAANIAWIRAAFMAARARHCRGLVLMTQANPGFENYWPRDPKSRYFEPFVARGQPIPSYPTAFDDYVATLVDEMETFEKPVAFLHGDTHLFRIDKPLYSRKTDRLFENFTRVETFGNPDTHWVLATVERANPQLFRFEPRIVAENAASRRAK